MKTVRFTSSRGADGKDPALLNGGAAPSSSPAYERSDSELGPAVEDAAERRHSLCSALTFQYFQRVMSTGRKRPLQKEDLPRQFVEDQAHVIGGVFAENLRRHGRVVRALVAAFGRPYLAAGLYKLPHDICIFVSPQLLKSLIKLIESDEPQLRVGLLYVLAIGLAGLLQTFCLQQYFHRVYRVSYLSMAALTTAIYDKSLLLSNAARGKHTIGGTVRAARARL